MGVFDESKCDCCVCPMQCVLEELEGQDVNFATTTGPPNFSITIIDVDNFIAFTSNGNIPICQFTGVVPVDPTITVNIKKQIKKSKGKCACCEDPMTNLLISLKGQSVQIEFIDGISGGIVTEIGEGIVILENNTAISTCAITRVIPFRPRQINDQSSFSGFRQLKKDTTPPTT
ncbi:hypothetical protein [Chengkuizengella axinellae]|uniref:Spore coat protein n=1 Tax=Chengkuizengella axinellae TaxID=3064388 RepID=A0ABT9J0U0_9BACL|nr:hypothetical protein [Chengkuizengella sp. 2205SS18-9]MDP5275098.1 hypothetical protein [Chengkuizengella sp. 2205SS18-9]